MASAKVMGPVASCLVAIMRFAGAGFFSGGAGCLAPELRFVFFMMTAFALVLFGLAIWLMERGIGMRE